MKVILHDLSQSDKLTTLCGEIHQNDRVFATEIREPLYCRGCFGCWLNTPGKCVIRDDYSKIGEYLGDSDEFIIISKCRYGEFSPNIKKVIDRSVSYCLPNFEKRNKETHHQIRYHNDLTLDLGIPLGSGTLKGMKKPYMNFINHITNRERGDIIYVRPNISSSLFRLVGNHLFWKSMTQKNSLRGKIFNILISAKY